MEGRLVGIGVGPGDAELMTLKAVRLLKESDVVVIPAESRESCHAYRIAVQAVPQLEEKEVRCMAFPMTRDENILDTAIAAFTENIVAGIKDGERIAFLTIGDPTVYSTYNYLHRRVASLGYEAVIVSGVPSFVAAAARLGISLADREEQLHVIPGSYGVSDSELYPGTRVYMKSGRYLAELKRQLLAEQERRGRELSVYAVSNCGMEAEKVMVGVENLDEESGYLTTVIVRG